MKKFLALLLALTMVLSMAACGTKNTDATDPAATNAGNNSNNEVTADAATYTYNSYTTALANNWNPHTWETNADNSICNTFLSTGLVDMSILDSENGVYQWVYQMATYIEDVTADHQDDLVTYGATLPEGKTAEEITAEYVYEIGLNPDAKWEDGTPINADTYIYSMEQLLNPEMKNYRANLYWSGESAVAGGYTYYYSHDEGVWTNWTAAYDSAEDAIADGKELCIDAWSLWGAEGYTDGDGNECAQYIPVTDETVYGEAQDDAFTAAQLYTTYGASYPEYVYYYEGNVNYDPDMTYDGTVGCYKVDEYTIRYVLQTAEELNYFLVSCATNWLVYEDLYEAGKDTTGTLVTTDYGTSIETTMSYGPYKLESLQDGKQMVLVQNENWFGFEKQDDGSLISYTNFDVDGAPVQQYQTTKYVIDVMENAAAKQAFMKGELTGWTPEADDLLTFSTSDRLYKVPETYTMSFFFNTGLDNLKAMDESKGNTNSVVLSNENFRKAWSLAVDREKYVTVTEGYTPAYALMNDLYFYDVYNDPTSSYRGSDEAMQAVCNLYGVEYGEGTPYATLKDAYKSINGYNLTQAQELMKTACEELVADGLYTEGAPIVIRIAWAAGAIDSAAQNQCTMMQDFLNAAVEGTGFGTITLEPIGNLTSRYSDVPNGEYAVGYGAWGGAAFYPFRNLQVYCNTDQYDINEAGCWDPSTETLTLTVEGEEVTMTWKDWSNALIGTGKFAGVDNKVKLAITAQLEELFLEKYYRIPLCATTACELLGYKVDYYTENYNIMYDFGGLRLMKYNYTDAEWAEYVASEGGTLSYE